MKCGLAMQRNYIGSFEVPLLFSAGFYKSPSCLSKEKQLCIPKRNKTAA